MRRWIDAVQCVAPLCFAPHEHSPRERAGFQRDKSLWPPEARDLTHCVAAQSKLRQFLSARPANQSADAERKLLVSVRLGPPMRIAVACWARFGLRSHQTADWHRQFSGSLTSAAALRPAYRVPGNRRRANGAPPCRTALRKAGRSSELDVSAQFSQGGGQKLTEQAWCGGEMRGLRPPAAKGPEALWNPLFAHAGYGGAE